MAFTDRITKTDKVCPECQCAIVIDSKDGVEVHDNILGTTYCPKIGRPTQKYISVDKLQKLIDHFILHEEFHISDLQKIIDGPGIHI